MTFHEPLQQSHGYRSELNFDLQACMYIKLANSVYETDFHGQLEVRVLKLLILSWSKYSSSNSASPKFQVCSSCVKILEVFVSKVLF